MVNKENTDTDLIHPTPLRFVSSSFRLGLTESRRAGSQTNHRFEGHGRKDTEKSLANHIQIQYSFSETNQCVYF